MGLILASAAVAVAVIVIVPVVVAVAVVPAAAAAPAEGAVAVAVVAAPQEDEEAANVSKEANEANAEHQPTVNRLAQRLLSAILGALHNRNNAFTGLE